MTDIRIIRQGPDTDDLTEQDYRDIFDDLRHGSSLRIFARRIGSAVSASYWSQYEAGDKRLNHARKTELRRAVGLPALPAPAGEVLAQADIAPDATVYQVGAGPVERAILVAHSAPSTLNLRLNGALSYTETCAMSQVGVTPVTLAKRRLPRHVVNLPENLFIRLNAARQEAGLSWVAYLARLVEEEVA